MIVGIINKSGRTTILKAKLRCNNENTNNQESGLR